MSKKGNNRNRDDKPDQSENAATTGSVEAKIKAVGETGAAWLGPMLQKSVTVATFKFLTGAGQNIPLIQKFLDMLGTFDGAIEALPGFANDALRRLFKVNIFGSEVITDEFRELVVHVADGIVDAVRHGNGLNLLKIEGKTAEIVKAAAQKVAEIKFLVDAEGYGHRVGCRNAEGLKTEMNYEQAVAANLKINGCCARSYRKVEYARVVDARRREQEALEVLGNMEEFQREDYLEWVRQLPSLENQAVAMHALSDLSTNAELDGFLSLNYKERFQWLPLLHERVVKRHGAREMIEATIQRFIDYDEKQAAEAEARRLTCFTTWNQLYQPVPWSIFGMLGA